MATGTSAAPKNVKNLNFPQFYSKKRQKKVQWIYSPFLRDVSEWPFFRGKMFFFGKKRKKTLFLQCFQPFFT